MSKIHIKLILCNSCGTYVYKHRRVCRGKRGGYTLNVHSGCCWGGVRICAGGHRGLQPSLERVQFYVRIDLERLV